MTNMNKKYLNIQEILKKPHEKITSEQALRDIEKIKWDNDVVQGKTKVTVQICK